MDESLKYYPVYKKWELVWSEERQELVRFVRYTNKDRKRAKVANMQMSELPGTVLVSKIRRPVGDGPSSTRSEPLPEKFVRDCDEARKLLRGKK